MRRSLKNRVSAMDAVYRFCLENPLVWSMLLALSNAIAALGLVLQSIVSTEAKQESNNKGVTLTKAVLKKNMVSIAASVAAAIQALAKLNGDNTLFEKLNFNEGTTYRGSGETAISKCREVYTLVNAIPAVDRDAYGVTNAVLLSLKNATDDFENNGKSSTRNVVTQKTALTEMLVTLVNQGNGIMRNEILKLALQLRETNPEFYIALRQNAKVISANTHTKLRIDAINDESNEVISDMKVKVLNSDLSAVTNSKGKCSIYLEEGNYSIECSKPNYITMTLNIKVKKGSNTVKVQMVPSFVMPETVKENVNS